MKAQPEANSITHHIFLLEGKVMSFDKQRAQQHLKAFAFKNLFIEELGWDYSRERPLAIPSVEQTYTLRPLAEKSGVVVYICDPNTYGAIPDYPRRRQIDKEVMKIKHEHLIIYVNAAKEHQIWQWVRREPGKPTTNREYSFHKSQSGESL